MHPLIALVLLVAPALGARLPFIIGGEEATKGEFPWQGSLQLLGGHICGCSLISDRYVLTAAHCIMLPTFLSVKFGAHDFADDGKDVVEVFASRFVTHPDWDSTGDGFPNDIAVGELTTSVTENDYIKKIALAPSTATDSDFSDCDITGWGIDKVGSQIPPDVLQKASVGIYLRAKCEEMWKPIGGATINDGHICVGVEGSVGACSGDSGGPLTCTYKGSTVQAGLTSWGIATCQPVYPSVYTRISYFREWIDGVVAGTL